ncbi:pectinesterase family protein [Chitinophaga rhizophila]|uniref:Pectinesterase n=1 Tax=Chitinophaga rhizophila TaxID=2866212 RepID=A0ABS7GAJ4_9BACT|nr:pectinesterase family protein [Chitinophaga rhizophila]MBW8684678.1 pectin esterase [Chitinophaga rhizophila]
MKNTITSALLALTFFACTKADITADQALPAGGTIAQTPSAVVAYNIVVAKDGSGNYSSVQQAFNAVPNNSSSRTVIFIKNGVYKEVLTLESGKKNVTVIGESVNGVKLTYDNYASKINPATGAAYGTSGSSSTFIRAEGFYAVNVTFENSSGPVGQALAIYISGDKAVFNNCRFLGRQDTYYGGNCRQYLRNCYLEGTTDFIFGPATAVFESCKLYSYGGSAITAASTESYVPYGFVFLKCNISGASGASTDLGRPWRPYAAVSYQNTAMSAVIKPAGWNNWGNAANEATARYSEYRNNGNGSNINARPSWIKRLTDAEAQQYTVKNILKTKYTNPVTTDNWDPGVVISQTGAPVN